MSLTCMDPKFDTDFCFTKLLYGRSLRYKYLSMTLTDCFIFFLYGDLRSATDYFSFQKILKSFFAFLVLFLIFAESWLDSWILSRPAFSSVWRSVTESAGERFEKLLSKLRRSEHQTNGNRSKKSSRWISIFTLFKCKRKLCI